MTESRLPFRQFCNVREPPAGYVGSLGAPGPTDPVAEFENATGLVWPRLRYLAGDRDLHRFWQPETRDFPRPVLHPQVDTVSGDIVGAYRHNCREVSTEPLRIADDAEQ